MTGDRIAPWYEPEDWIRATRGRSHRFFATDDDVRDLLETALPARFAPYSVIAYDNVKVDAQYRHVVKEASTADFLGTRTEGWESFSVRSEMLSPGMDLSGRRFVDDLFWTSGLIGLSHGFISNKLGWEASRIGLVNQIMHRRTGETVIHDDYQKVFFALRRAIKKRVRYRTLRVRPSGVEEEEETHVHMTEGFVLALRAGEIESAFYPGDPL